MYNFYCCIKDLYSSTFKEPCLSNIYLKKKKNEALIFPGKYRNFQTYYKQKTSLCCVSVH